jgi:hypothetical protein
MTSGGSESATPIVESQVKRLAKMAMADCFAREGRRGMREAGIASAEAASIREVVHSCSFRFTWAGNGL